jgi:hypothetical protein
VVEAASRAGVVTHAVSLLGYGRLDLAVTDTEVIGQ